MADLATQKIPPSRDVRLHSINDNYCFYLVSTQIYDPQRRTIMNTQSKIATMTMLMTVITLTACDNGMFATDDTEAPNPSLQTNNVDIMTNTATKAADITQSDSEESPHGQDMTPIDEPSATQTEESGTVGSIMDMIKDDVNETLNDQEVTPQETSPVIEIEDLQNTIIGMQSKDADDLK